MCQRDADRLTDQERRAIALQARRARAIIAALDGRAGALPLNYRRTWRGRSSTTWLTRIAYALAPPDRVGQRECEREREKKNTDDVPILARY